MKDQIRDLEPLDQRSHSGPIPLSLTSISQSIVNPVLFARFSSFMLHNQRKNWLVGTPRSEFQISLSFE